MANGGVFYPVRVFFEKRGRIKYISHLDLNRCIGRTLKRSALPVWHTQGFHPHIYVTFALPLSLGCEGLCESFDFRLTEQISMQTVVDRLNAVFPEGLRAIRADAPIQLPAAIARADSRVTLEYDRPIAAQAASAFADWCARPELWADKRTKKGTRQIDLKPLFSVSEQQAQDCIFSFCMRTAAGEQLNINPSLILDTFAAESGFQPGWTQIVRTAILDEQNKAFE